MIATERITNLDGDISIPTSSIIHLKNGRLLTGAGDIITLGTTTGGETGGEPETPPTNPTEVQDLTLDYTPLAIDNAVSNIIHIEQESGQTDFSNYQMIITQNEFTLGSGGSNFIALSKIKMNVNSAGYQIVKILLYDENDALIPIYKVDSDSLMVGSGPILVDITATAFSLITNATYELANILNTAKMPVAATGGWYSLTSNTDATASFEAVFSASINVSRAVIYRQGASSTTFNGGTNDYTVKFIDTANVEKVISVPKVDNSIFTGISNPTNASFTGSGATPDPSTKVRKFTLTVSLNGSTFEDISDLGTTVTTQNPTTLAYKAVTTYPKRPIGSKHLYFKIPDADIPFLQGVKINMWKVG